MDGRIIFKNLRHLTVNLTIQTKITVSLQPDLKRFAAASLESGAGAQWALKIQYIIYIEICRHADHLNCNAISEGLMHHDLHVK